MGDSTDRQGMGGRPGDGPEGRSRFGAGGPGARGAAADGPKSRQRRGGPGSGRYMPRRKVCGFCVDNIADVDYKDIARLRRHVSERGKIEPRRKAGTCARHQRSLTIAIKRARHVALIPFTTGARG